MIYKSQSFVMRTPYKIIGCLYGQQSITRHIGGVLDILTLQCEVDCEEDLNTFINYIKTNTGKFITFKDGLMKNWNILISYLSYESYLNNSYIITITGFGYPYKILKSVKLGSQLNLSIKSNASQIKNFKINFRINIKCKFQKYEILKIDIKDKVRLKWNLLKLDRDDSMNLYSSYWDMDPLLLTI